MPDIDVDFCQANRARVIEYTRNKYGSEQVCQILTFGTLKPKAVLKDVGRVLEIPYSTVEKITKMVPEGPKLKSLAQAYRENPDLATLREDPAYHKYFDMAERLEGINRHEGKHAAGVVISDINLLERIPLTLVKGDKATQFTMTEVEEAGLLKMDFLGLQTLTLIECAITLIRKRGIELDLDGVPLDDKETFEMLSRGDSRAVFQLESSGFRKLLKEAKPDRFEDIIALIALYRPGPLGSEMDKTYIARKHKREPVTYLTDLLAPILDETYGCILYQEQVMRIANIVAGLSMSDADNLRKAMGKKKLDLMNKYKPQFVKGFEAKGVKAKIAEEVWSQIAFFAEYGFNKSHSAAYGLITYRTAYLKAHYPAEFMAATLTSWLGQTDRLLEYAGDCDRMGIEVMPPDINTSDVRFDVRDGKIIYGLAAIKGLGEGAVQGIVEAREKLGTKSFRSIFHVAEEVDCKLLGKSALEALAKAGAFDTLGHTRSQNAAIVETAVQMGVQAQKDKNSNQTSLFGDVPTSGPSVEEIEKDLMPTIPEWRDSDKLAFEKEAIGYYLTQHPLDSYKETIERYASTQISKLSNQGQKADVTVGGLITNVRSLLTKKGKQMAFVTLEDFTGACDLVVFPSVYGDVRDKLVPETVIFVQGKVDTDREPPSVLVDKILTIEQAEGALRVSVSAELVLEETDKEMINNFREALIKFRGNDQVYFTFVRASDNQKAGPFRVGAHLKVTGNDAFKEELLQVLGPSTKVSIGARL
jgi:DNA polymerase-3 subunit alpha